MTLQQLFGLNCEQLKTATTTQNLASFQNSCAASWPSHIRLRVLREFFSQLNIIKTKKTNRLHVSTVANRLLAKQAIARKDGACHKWEPSTSLIEDVKSGQCHRRYNEREAERQQGEVATLHADDDPEAPEENPLCVFLQ